MAVPVRRRTRAREFALQFLYMMELCGEDAMEELVPFVEHHAKSGERKDREEIRDFTLDLCRGVLEHRSQLDRWIEAIARNWRLERMAHVDRNVLRIAVYELLHHREIPYKVVINEAIDVAKRFSTSQSGAFVNGILDRARVLIEEGRAAGDEMPPPPSREEAQSSPEPEPQARPLRARLERDAGRARDEDAPSPADHAAPVPRPTRGRRKPGS